LNPSNPRLIRDKTFRNLVESLRECPKLFEARPCLVTQKDGLNVIIGGNMRYLAAKELKYKEIPCIIFSDLTEKQEREIMIKDNGLFGEWDFDMLANEYSDLPLDSWGVDIPEHNIKEDKNTEERCEICGQIIVKKSTTYQ
jgi:hypothetical protein